MDCFHLELAIKAQVAHPTPRRAIKKWVLFLGTLNAVVIGICPFHKCRINVNYAAFRGERGMQEKAGISITRMSLSWLADFYVICATLK